MITDFPTHYFILVLVELSRLVDLPKAATSDLWCRVQRIDFEEGRRTLERENGAHGAFRRILVARNHSHREDIEG